MVAVLLLAGSRHRPALGQYELQVAQPVLVQAEEGLPLERPVRYRRADRDVGQVTALARADRDVHQPFPLTTGTGCATAGVYGGIVGGGTVRVTTVSGCGCPEAVVLPMMNPVPSPKARAARAASRGLQ
jgi:hypothetical protein